MLQVAAEGELLFCQISMHALYSCVAFKLQASQLYSGHE